MSVQLPFTIPLGFNQLTTITSAVGPANGSSTVASAVVGNSGGTNYSIGDQVTIGGTGKQAIFFVTGVSAGGVVTAVSLNGNWGANPISGMYVTGSTPGTTNVTTSNISVANASAAGLTLNVTYAANTPPANTQYTLIQAITDPIVWRDDGVAPTASIGTQQLTTVVPFRYEGNPSNLLIIQQTTGAVANVTFWGIVGNQAIGR